MLRRNSENNTVKKIGGEVNGGQERFGTQNR